MNDEMEVSFGRIVGYSLWAMENKDNRTGLQTQELDVAVPHLTEALFLWVVLAYKSGYLIVSCTGTTFQNKELR